MKAITQTAYGPPDALKLEDVAKPQPGDGEVLVRVHAASVNPADHFMVRGDPYLIRLSGTGLLRPKQRIPGQDVAGVVEALGQDVTRFQVGDEVFGYGKGAFAEYLCVPAAHLQPRPGNITLEQAATIGIAAFTALHALRNQGRVQAGHKVLIIGASGGVGTFAVQFARAFGAEVTGVCSTRNVERVRSLGADRVLDYTTQDFAAEGPTYDVIVRVAGDRTVRQCRRALLPRGSLVLVGGGHYGRWTGGMERFLGTALLNLVTRQRLRPFVSISNSKDLQCLRKLVEMHDIQPLIDRRYVLADAPEAIRYVEEGHAQGKVVITP